MAAKPDKKSPFYIQVTKVKEDFTNERGEPASVDLPLVTLPAGTVLFRGMKIPNPAIGEDIRYFYRDFLGNPEGANSVCLSPIHNVFFYPFPYVAFGANDVGKTFNMMQAIVLVHPVTLVCAVSPSDFVRGMGQRYGGTAPWQRCSNLTGAGIECHPSTYQEADAASYDNCLHPDYQVRSGTRGWMALADLDSINPKKKKWDMLRGEHKLTTMKDSTMGTFIRTLEGQLPGEGTKAIGMTYTDEHRHAGFPEIVIYPYRNHKGSKLIVRSCPNQDAAMHLISKEALADNLNYLPLAAFTKNGVADMVGEFFSYDTLGVTANAFSPLPAQQAILKAVYQYMGKLQTNGINLPFYGQSKLTFDTRTGFFVMDKVVPQNLKLPIPRPILNAEKTAGYPAKFPTIPYRFLLLGLGSYEEQRRAMAYILLFRSFLPEHFMEKYQIEKGFAMRRAMIFNRFPVLTPIFTELELKAPKTFFEPLDRAGKIYRKEMGIEKKSKVAAATATATALPPPPITLPPDSRTPAGTPPAIVPESPTYAPMTPPAYAPMTPPGTPPGTPPPLKGGKRKTRKQRVKRGTTRKKDNRTGENRAMEYASMFRSIWKLHNKH